MITISHAEAQLVEAEQSGGSTMDSTAMTYGLFRMLLMSSGIVDEREGQKMDRAIDRLLAN